MRPGEAGCETISHVRVIRDIQFQIHSDGRDQARGIKRDNLLKCVLCPILSGRLSGKFSAGWAQVLKVLGCGASVLSVL